MKQLLILSGPSGIGKTYLSKLLIQKYPNLFEHAKVYTTRPKRHNDDMTAINRIFVSEKEFEEINVEKPFYISEKFAGYSYGYQLHDLHPTSKHIIVDVSPWLLKDFLQRKDVVFTGMIPSKNWEKFLTQRMVKRKDATEVIKSRLPFIKKDISDLKNLHIFYSSNKRNLFQVETNKTVIEEIMPWIEDQLKLNWKNYSPSASSEIVSSVKLLSSSSSRV